MPLLSNTLEVLLLRGAGFSLLIVSVFIVVGTVTVPGEPAAALLLALPSLIAGCVGCVGASKVYDLNEQAEALKCKNKYRGHKALEQQKLHTGEGGHFDVNQHSVRSNNSGGVYTPQRYGGPSKEMKIRQRRKARAKFQSNTLSLLLRLSAILLLIDGLAGISMAIMSGTHQSPALEPQRTGGRLSTRFMAVMIFLGVFSLICSALYWSCANAAQHDYTVILNLVSVMNMHDPHGQHHGVHGPSTPHRGHHQQQPQQYGSQPPSHGQEHMTMVNFRPQNSQVYEEDEGDLELGSLTVNGLAPASLPPTQQPPQPQQQQLPPSILINKAKKGGNAIINSNGNGRPAAPAPVQQPQPQQESAAAPPSSSASLSLSKDEVIHGPTGSNILLSSSGM